jgi:hypothetical protein
MADTIHVLALVIFCILSGYLLAHVQQVIEQGKQAIGLLQLQTKLAQELLNAMNKPIDLPDYKPPGVYEIDSNGRPVALVDRH